MQSPTQQTSLAWFTVAVIVAGLLLAIWQVLHARPLIAGFNLNHAMDTAGTAVPSELDSFYFFVPESGRSRDTEITELSKLLGQAAAETDHIGVAGADVERNRAQLLAAIEATPAGLQGATVVYLGPDEHQAELRAAVEKTGGEFKFVRYPPLPDNAI